MTKYLLAAACLALASCAAQKALPHYTPEQQAAQRGGISWWKPDSASLADTLPHTPSWAVKVPAPAVDSIVVERPASFIDKLLGRTPKPYHVAVTPARIGKKSTVSFYYGPATVTTTTLGKKATGAVGDGAAVVVAAKKAGPVVLADSGASVQVATAKKGQAAAGDGIRQQHEEVKPGPWPAIIGGVGLVGGIGLVYWLVAGGGALWLAGFFKRRKAETQA